MKKQKLRSKQCKRYVWMIVTDSQVHDEEQRVHREHGARKDRSAVLAVENVVRQMRAGLNQRSQQADVVEFVVNVVRFESIDVDGLLWNEAIC